MLTTKDANGNQTQYVYDDAGRRTQTIDALNHTTFFTYDDAGAGNRGKPGTDGMLSIEIEEFLTEICGLRRGLPPLCGVSIRPKDSSSD